MRVAVPGESLGPGQRFGDDQRRGRLAPITLRLHPLPGEKRRNNKVHPNQNAV